MTTAPTLTEKPKTNVTTHKLHLKTSIAQRFRTDLGRSVGETISTKLVNGIPILTLTTTVV